MFSRWIHIDPNKSALIVGPRRSGKTTYLRTSFPDIPYVTLDDLDALNWAQQDPKGFVSSLGSRAIIDEIQRAPALTIAIKFAIDTQDALFFLTGSSSIGLLDAAADTLAGRINIYHFPTACWGEDVSAGRPSQSLLTHPRNLPEIKVATRRLSDHMKYGFFPEVLNQSNDADRLDVLNNYKNTYFTRDLMQLSNIDSLDGIRALYYHLIRSIGSHLEISSFSRASGLSFPTAKKYLHALAQAELTVQLRSYAHGPAKRYLKATKTYFADSGMITAFGGDIDSGLFLENFVISELEKRRKLGFIASDELFYYQSVGGQEIDVVFEHQGETFAIEIKATDTVQPRHLRNLRDFSKQLDSKRRCRPILFYTGTAYDRIDGIQIVPIAALFGTGF